MNYTKEQEQAIFLRDKNIMVSAGAGAGKIKSSCKPYGGNLLWMKKSPVEADSVSCYDIYERCSSRNERAY